MSDDFSSAASRRSLLRRLAELTALIPGPGHAAAPGSGTSHPDAALLAACVAFGKLEHAKQRLLDGPGRIEDDDHRDALLDPLFDQQLLFLDAVCEQRATTEVGHRARALAFLLWDGGHLFYLAQISDTFEDRLLAAMLRDLAAPPC